MKNRYHFIGLGLALVGILLSVNELNEFYNYLKLQSFLTRFGLIGLALAIAAGFWLKRKTTTSGKADEANLSTIILIAIGLITLTISLGSKLNRHFSDKNPECSSFEVIAKDAKKGYRDSRFFIQVTSETIFKEVTITKENWEKITPDDKVIICNHQGFFGYTFNTLND